MNSSSVFADKAVSYFLKLKQPALLPSSFSIINPYRHPEVRSIVYSFFQKFYNDDNKRIYLFGINPGRFGGGITGIPFTDPAALETYCGITNTFKKQRELSSIFIYELITSYGGTNKFFSSFYLTALYPLTIMSNGKNFNYYDDPAVMKLLQDDIRSSIKGQFNFGACKKTAVSLGKKNALYLKRINDELGLFEIIEIMEHPRFIMQYRRKYLAGYISDYVTLLSDLKKKWA